MRAAAAVVAALLSAAAPAHAQLLPPPNYGQVDDDEVALGAGVGVEGGVVGLDAVLQLNAALWVTSAPFSARLAVPLTLRLWDAPPAVDPALPPACRALRCEEWLQAGQLSPQAVARLVDEVRLFVPGAPVHARAGRLVVTLGHGQLVERATGALEWDRRTSGVYVEGNAESVGLAGRAFANDALSPQHLAGARVEWAPARAFLDDDAGLLAAFIGRVSVGLEAAGDGGVPVDPAGVDRFGDIVPGARSRPLFGAAVDVTAPLLAPGPLQVSPFVSGSGLWGLAADGGAAGCGGAGGQGGVDARVGVGGLFVGVGVAAGADSPCHRAGVFSTFYDVERRRALSGAVVEAGSIARVPAPGGFTGSARVDVNAFEVVLLSGRVIAGSAPESHLAELRAGLGAGPLRVSAAALSRVGGVDGASLSRAVTAQTVAVLDAVWAVYAPVSLTLRVQRTPRFDPQSGALRLDVDATVGVSVDAALASR